MNFNIVWQALIKQKCDCNKWFQTNFVRNARLFLDENIII